MAKKKKDGTAGSKKNVSEKSAPEVTPEVSQVSAAFPKDKADELPFTLYIPAPVLKHMKIMSATDGISIKKLINTALTEKYKIPAP